MNHYERIQKSIDFIEAHLKDKITLLEVSEKACFSLYHFFRTFHALTGESPADYIRKRRLASAAFDLLATENRILDLALDYQFESQEAFTRSFKKEFGVTPGKFRRDKSGISFYGKTVLTNKNLQWIQGGKIMDVKYITMPEMLVIGPEIFTTVEINKKDYAIPKFWEDMNKKNIYNQIPNQKNMNRCFGICICDEKRPDGFIYQIALEVTTLDQIPSGMTGRRIAPARYAVFTAKGKAPQAIWETLDYIYGKWLPSGHERTNAPDFELYDNRFDGSENSEMDIYIPIQ